MPEYDPNARILYGFALNIRSPDGTVTWSETIYTRTRQSKDDERDGRFRFENTFGVNSDEQYGDDRLLEIRLPNGLPDGARLEVHLLGTAGDRVQVQRALVRSYRQITRSRVARRYRYLSLSASRKQSMARRVDMPWDILPEDTKLSLLSNRWERMAALGEDGIDYRTQLVFYTGFRLAPERDDEKHGVHVHRLHQAAINVLADAPTEITLQAMRFDGESKRCAPRLDQVGLAARTDETAAAMGTGTEIDIDIDIDSVSNTFGVLERISIPSSGRGVTHLLRIPDGLHTLRFRTESPVGAVFCLIADSRDEVQFGYIQTVQLGPDLEQLVVDVRRLPGYVSGFDEGESAIVTYVDGPPELQARLFMFETRMLMSGEHWLGAKPRLRYRFYDAQNNELGVGSTELQPVFAPFEKVRMDVGFDPANPDGAPNPETTDPDTSDPEATDEEPGARTRARKLSVAEESALVRPVSEPIRFQLLAPASARRLEVDTDQPSVIRVLSRLDDRSRYDLPYRDYALDGILWRYGPRERRPWYPTRPENREELANSGRIARIRAQVRLQPRLAPVVADGDRRAVLIEPIRPRQRQLILEQIAVDRKATLRDDGWPRAAYTLLERPRRIAVPGRTGKRPRIRYLVQGKKKGDGARILGMRVRIAIQGMDPIVKRLSTPRGIWNLPYLPKGAPLVGCTLLGPEDVTLPEAELRALASNFRCYIDRPPNNSVNATIVRARTVFPLSHRPLRLKVVKSAGQHLVVNAVVYSQWPSARPGRLLHATIDGGRPKRSIGTLVSGLTLADRWWPLAAPRNKNPALFVDLANRSPGYSRIISIRLGDDVSAGTHYISLEAPRLDAWVRFFTYDINPARQESAWQWKFEAP